MATEQTITISGTPTVVSGVTVPYVKTSDLEVYVGKGKIESIEVTNAGAGYTDRKLADSAARLLVFSGGSGGTSTTPTHPTDIYTTVGENNSGRDSGTFDGKYYDAAASGSDETTFPKGSDYTLAPNISVENFDGGTGAQLTAKIYAIKTSVTDYSISGTSGSATITFTSALSNGDKVLVKRVTGVSSATNTYNAGSAITAKELNDSFNQLRHRVEELPEVTSTAVTNGIKNDINVSGNTWTIVDDAVTGSKLSNNIDIAGTLDVTGNAIFDNNVNIKGDNKTFTIEKADGTDKFTVASQTGNTTVAGTLGVTGATTLTGALAANAGITVDTDKFTVADSTGATVIDGTLTVNTGIIPDADEGAYLGTAAKPFSDAHIGEVRIADSTNDGEIDTASGNLTLDSAGGTVAIDDNATISGTLAVTGKTSITGGPLCLGDGSELTIGTVSIDSSDVTGCITVTTSYHRVDTESDADPDNLDAIHCASYTTGQLLVLRSANNGRDVQVRDNQNSGQSYNIRCGGTVDLADARDVITLIWDTEWYKVADEFN